MADTATTVIVGAGMGGATTALTLRRLGYDGRVVLIGAEPALPYERPLLSKRFLADEDDAGELVLVPQQAYDDAAIDLRLERSVSALDLDERAVHLDDRSSLVYDHLVIATGSVARPLSIPGSDLSGVHSLRSLGDAEAIRASASQASRAVVVGMGVVGAEVAGSLRERGLDVTVVEPLARPMARVLPHPVAEVVLETHRAHGIEVLLGENVATLAGDGHVETVRLSSGRVLPADLVVAGVGAQPAVALARDAGLATRSGVVVDAGCRTARTEVFAIGDVAEQWFPHLGRHVRVEHYQGAVRQGEVVARRILGEDTEHDEVPWFWSDQLDLQIHGVGLLAPDADYVIRGSLAERRFVCFALHDGVITSAVGIGAGRDVRQAARLVKAGVPVPAEALRDESITLKQLAASAA